MLPEPSYYQAATQMTGRISTLYGLPMIHSFIHSWYGQLRGYDRRAIRLRVQANQTLPPDVLEEYSRRQFQKRVMDAIERFPDYAAKVEEFRGSLPKGRQRIHPEELPVWSRRDQLQLFDKATRAPIEPSYTYSTCGSTGVPVRFYATRKGYEWKTAVSNRGYSWAGAEEGKKSVYIWGAPLKGPGITAAVKQLAGKSLHRRIYFDAFHRFGEEAKKKCCALINRSRPAAIVGYTGYLVDLARFAREHPARLKWKAKTLVIAAEGLQPGQKELLEATLAEEVFLAYGSREFMLIGMECPHHSGYHLMTDSVRVESVTDEGYAVEAGQRGRLLITDLRNAATPFIRYEIGDYGVLESDEDLCPCGLPFPLLRSVEGRLQDMVYTSDGNKISALFITHVIRQFEWIEGYQVVQDGVDKLHMKLLTQVELTAERTQPVTAMLRKRLGADMEVSYERVAELARRPSGKVALVERTLDPSI
jgi:phenylacetate-CoA ligase